MFKLIIMNKEIVQAAEKEFKVTSFDFDKTAPLWFMLAKKAKYEFMQQVILTIPNFVFSERESSAILKKGEFLKQCWLTWNSRECSIEEAMKYAADNFCV